MKLSIIVVNYNTREITLQCIKSIEKYPLSQPFEVILVDNNSHDNSVSAFKELKIKNFKLKIIRNDANLGFAKANNQGIKIAKGEYVLLLNSDTEVLKNSLNKYLEETEKLAEAGVVGCKLLNSDKTVQESVFRFPSITRAFRQYMLGQKNILDKYYPKTNSPKEVEVVVGAAFMITPSAFKKVGMLNEKYFMYFEDFDYCREIRKAGLKVYYLPQVKILHHHGKSGGDWKKLVKSSKIYHGPLKHYIIFLITWCGQKLKTTGL